MRCDVEVVPDVTSWVDPSKSSRVLRSRLSSPNEQSALRPTQVTPIRAAPPNAVPFIGTDAKTSDAYETFIAGLETCEMPRQWSESIEHGTSTRMDEPSRRAWVAATLRAVH